MNKRYDILEFVSQRKNGEMPPENDYMVHIANVIRRTTCNSRGNEAQTQCCSGNVADLNDSERRCAERWAKENNRWLPMDRIFSLGSPGPSGSESDTYLSSEGYVYKTNNLMHCQDSMVCALEKCILYNIAFPDSAYSFVGFTGFDGRSVYPIVRQRYIKDGVHATQNEIDCYMAALGFEKTDKGRYCNSLISVWDVLPKNVLKDNTGDMFVIDAEIELNHLS